MEEVYLNYDAGFDSSINFNLPGFTISAADWVPPAPNATASTDAAGDPTAQSKRRYVFKRPHRKSRAGCKQCKKRKVKCDEARPACKACTLRNEQCVYWNVPASVAKPSSTGGTNLVVRSKNVSGEELDIGRGESEFGSYEVPVVTEPLFIPAQAADVIDMKMLWFYSTCAFNNFSINSGHSPEVDYALKVKIVEHAFHSPFLMEALKALSALQLQALGQTVPSRKIAAYQARAFEGYRDAIEAANPIDYPAIFGCSLFMVVMSSQNFRSPYGKRLFVIDWIPIWRGMGIIIRWITPQAVQDSGLAALFTRPPIDMEKASRYIPKNLLLMVSIQDGDADYEHKDDYYELLQYLGSLYMELIEHGFNPILDLRIITFFSFFPRALFPLARQLRPRILVVIAYWLCFVKIVESRGSWWLQGITPQAYQIFDELGEEWEHLLRIPKMVMKADDKVEVARLLTGDPNWTPGDLDLYGAHRDPRTKTDLKMITDYGNEVVIVDGQWKLKEGGTILEIGANGANWALPPGTDYGYKAALKTTSAVSSPPVLSAAPSTPTPSLSSSGSRPSPPDGNE
ncbi:hypothetical protein F4861DRAFT_206612 [Xylaria intraflava]|nr:hypothetical protein F4861DRAFT_206612 [Xylaria intraflava]